jgi:rsbT co-antagonist protein RsbR
MSDLVPPSLRPDERAMLAEYWHFFEPHADAINVELLRVLETMPNWAPMIRAMKPEDMAAQNKRSTARTRAALVDNDWTEYLADLHQQGKGYAKSGISFAAWFEILAAYRDAVRHRIVALAREDMTRATMVSDGMNRHLDIAMGFLGEAYLETKEEIIREQQEAIREISTPVLQVRDRLLIMPVVGLVDTHRARFLTEGLLRAIRDRRARGVVMDITGVPIVDSKVANHLAQACEAARLMGAVVVMTGISSEIAQTLVAIGAQLRGVRMVGDLQGGIEEIDRLLEHPREDDDPLDEVES